MNSNIKQNGFSLVEILLAIGVLAVGLILVAGVFPVGIRYTSLMMERSVAPSIADEAFAKIQIFAMGDYIENDPNGYGETNRIAYSALGLENMRTNSDSIVFDETVSPAFESFGTYTTEQLEQILFSWPTDYDSNDISENFHISHNQKQYSWAALLNFATEYDGIRNPNPPLLITVFACRRNLGGARYYETNYGGGVITGTNGSFPQPVLIEDVSFAAATPNVLGIDRADGIYFQEGSFIVDDVTGRVYRVIEKIETGGNTELVINPAWDDREMDLENDGIAPQRIWTVPAPVGGGRNPVIAVYQRVIQLPCRDEEEE